ncbi:hypothetical protein FQP81_18585 [Pseudoalteromonas distincta]|nr:hypothetical protein FQP81_18585 [Pseudoalteromonas elyakovii]
MLNQFEGLNLTQTAFKTSDIEQLNNEIFAWLSTRFSHLRIDHLIKRIGMTPPQILSFALSLRYKLTLVIL